MATWAQGRSRALGPMGGRGLCPPKGGSSYIHQRDRVDSVDRVDRVDSVDSVDSAGVRASENH